MKIITIKEFEKSIWPLHKECNMDGETISDAVKQHIERFICYDHNQDWFVDIEKKV